MNIMMIIILILILVFQISMFIMISAKDLTVDERKENRIAAEPKVESNAADEMKAQKIKREYEDYMRDIAILNSYGNEENNRE